MGNRLFLQLLGIGLCGQILLNFPVAAQETIHAGEENIDSPQDKLDLPPEIIEDSPVLQRWLKEIPDVLEDIRRDPSFRTRLQLGFALFPSTESAAGINVGVKDIFIGRTGLTLSADYQTAFNGSRVSVGTDLHYFLFPLGGYVNFAPLVGYRYVQSNDYFTDGVRVGGRLMLALSRTGAADISLSQSFISPGGENEVGITNLAVGYAVTSQLRLSTELEQQNSREAKDNRVTINLEWML
ncbi:hypothetical protein IQ238_04120 [Pleurocapsales cyanobacterium LEGE 06147]|nr:hypothetical protein [Pleurocapsales cyanobacterium LEGE 06147]